MGTCACSRDNENFVNQPQVFDAAAAEAAIGHPKERASSDINKPPRISYFDGLRNSYAFPAPQAPSYTAEGPLTVHSLDQCKYSPVDEHSNHFRDFDAHYFSLPNSEAEHGNDRVPCIGFSHPSASQVLVWGHANQEDMWSAHSVLDKLRQQLCVHVITFEYPGYSSAPGQPTELSATQNANCVYRYLIEDQCFDPEDIILFGRSLGSAVLTQCAARHKVGALILLSPFTSIRSVVQHGLGHSTLGEVAASLISDCFKTVEIIEQVEAPLLIVHGLLDQLVPLNQARMVLKAAGSTIKQLHAAQDVHATHCDTVDITPVYI